MRWASLFRRKPNTISTVDKNTFLKSVEGFFKTSKLLMKDLNYVINSVKRVTNHLKNLKLNNTISEENYNKLRPAGSNWRTLYGWAKVHNSLKNGLLSFGPIALAFGTSAYKLENFLVAILFDVAKNESKVQCFFSFVGEGLIPNSILNMTSFDVDSLFTNIPLDETLTFA